MNILDNIFREYREACFLVRDNMADDKAVDLLAHQNILSKQQIKRLFTDLLEQYRGYPHDVETLISKVRKEIEEL